MQRRAHVVLMLFVALTLLSAWYSAKHLSIITSTANMIAADVPFRQNEARLDAAFPELDKVLVAIVSAPTETVRMEVLARFAQALAQSEKPQDGEALLTLWAPALDPYFQRSGLLYLELEELVQLVDRLAQMQPLLATLGRDQSLTGLLVLLKEIVSRPEFAGAQSGVNLAGANLAGASLVEPINRISAVIEAALVDDAMLTSAQPVDEDESITAEPAPLDWSNLLSPTVTAAKTEVLLARVGSNPRAAIEHMLAVRQNVLDTVHRELSAQVRIDLTGKLLLAREERRSVADNALLAGALSATAVLLLLVIGVGAWQYLVAILFALGCGLVLSIGYATLAIGHLNLISVSFAVLFIGLAVDFGIHLCLRCKEVHRSGDPLPVAVVRAMQQMSSPLALSALCAAVGFLAFLPTPYLGLAELGLIAAGGMFIALLCNFVVTPSLLRLLPTPVIVRARGVRADAAATGSLKSWQRQTARIILLIAVAAAIAAGPALTWVGIEGNPIDLQDPKSEAVRTFKQLVRDRFRSPYVASVVVSDATQALQLAAKLRQLPEVSSVTTFKDLVPDLQSDKLELIDQLDLIMAGTLALYAPRSAQLEPRAFDSATSELALEELEHALVHMDSQALEPAVAAAFGRLRKDLAALRSRLGGADPVGSQRLLLQIEELLLADLPFNMRRLATMLEAERVSSAELPAQLRTRYFSDRGQSRIEIRPSADLNNPDAMQAFAAAVTRVAPSAAGTPMTLTGAAAVVRESFLLATALAAIGVVLVLGVALRSVLHAALAIFPLLLSALLTLAATVWLGVPLNFANIIALPLLFGLGVAGSIHVIARWRERGDVRFVFISSTSRAVLFSALTTCASFSSLALSSHRGMASMGMLLAISLAISLFCTLLALPALLAVVQDWRDRADAGV